jgi:aquaporin Z
MEAWALGTFMISACIFGVLLEHPASPLHQAIDSALLRHALAGIAMGCTAVSIIYSPWGQRSGAHMNPAITLSYLTVGKVRPWDAVFYIAAQFAGGILGVIAADSIVGYPLRHSAVNYVVTRPGAGGAPLAFWGEFVISLVMMTTVLLVSNSKRFTRWTPIFAGLLVASFITIESPLSGMSMNPARTFGSAYSADEWSALWIYFTAPPAAMLTATQLYKSLFGSHSVFCAKFHHHNRQRCIFRCNYGALDANQ